MKRKMFIAVTVLILTTVTTAAGADISGKWIAERQNPQGMTQQTIFNFTVKGETLTGTISRSRGGDSEISEGKIEGDNISFTVVRTIGETEMKTLHRGKISGDEIKFTIERQGGLGGGMGGSGRGLGRGLGGGLGVPQELIAKRAN